MKRAGGIDCRLQLILLAAVLVAGRCARAQDESESSVKFSAEAASIFNKRCTACHTYGKGIKVGPDLKGVNDRRQRGWLVKFVHASSLVINSGDPTAVALFTQFKQQRMPDWTDLSEKQINDILDYVAVGGPDIKPADERNAELATPAEIENGRRLFTGETRMKYGAQPCAACHSAPGAGWGGTLAPDLGKIYFRYQDRALTDFLRHPCFQGSTGADPARYLTAKESFSIKAFLRHAALQPTAQTANAGGSANSAAENSLQPDTRPTARASGTRAWEKGRAQ